MSEKEKVTALTLKDFKKNKEKIACMTAYDAAFGKVLDSVGIDVILVGDSVGMVVQGHETTVPVSVKDMIYHSKMVNRGVSRAMVMVDMPFMSYSTDDLGFKNATRLMQAGANSIKIEGGEWITNREEQGLLYRVEDRFKLERVIPAKYNRCVIFPGNQMHGAYIEDYSRYLEKFRYTQVIFFHPR